MAEPQTPAVDPSSTTAEDDLSPDSRTSTFPVRRWLIALPLVILVGALLVSGPMRGVAARTMAVYWTDRAKAKHLAGDFDGALDDINRAIEWLPDAPQLYYVRGQLHADRQQLDESLADFDLVIRDAPKFAPAHAHRATVLGRLGRPDDAIAALDEMVRLAPDGDPIALNHRAYLRGLKNLQLDAALADIERAIVKFGNEDASLLDTRGYIQYRLGNFAAAQADLELSIELTEVEHRELRNNPTFKALPEVDRKALSREMDEMMAVLVHHRGLVHEALGNDEQARVDIERAERLGYDPANGVE